MLNREANEAVCKTATSIRWLDVHAAISQAEYIRSCSRVLMEQIDILSYRRGGTFEWNTALETVRSLEQEVNDRTAKVIESRRKDHVKTGR